MVATVPGLPALGLEPDHPPIETASTHESAKQSALRVAAHCALRRLTGLRGGAGLRGSGHTLGCSGAGAHLSGHVTVQLLHLHGHRRPGLAPHRRRAGVQRGRLHSRATAASRSGRRSTTRSTGRRSGTAISIFRSVGASVVLIGQPADSTARLTRNGSAVNQLYRSIAKATTGVTYDDAGQAVMAKGRFTWTLPCLSGEPCTGPHGTNIVRSPDGIHFCPNGKSTPDRGLEDCDVYSSGAFRFASAMLKAALVPNAPGEAGCGVPRAAVPHASHPPGSLQGSCPNSRSSPRSSPRATSPRPSRPWRTACGAATRTRRCRASRGRARRRPSPG